MLPAEGSVDTSIADLGGGEQTVVLHNTGAADHDVIVRAPTPTFTAPGAPSVCRTPEVVGTAATAAAAICVTVESSTVTWSQRSSPGCGARR